MMVMQKYGEAISQERIVGNSSLKKLFLHITR
jgi:hypothetical protein